MFSNFVSYDILINFFYSFNLLLESGLCFSSFFFLLANIFLLLTLKIFWSVLIILIMVYILVHSNSKRNYHHFRNFFCKEHRSNRTPTSCSLSTSELRITMTPKFCFSAHPPKLHKLQQLCSDYARSFKDFPFTLIIIVYKPSSLLFIASVSRLISWLAWLLPWFGADSPSYLHF